MGAIKKASQAAPQKLVDGVCLGRGVAGGESGFSISLCGCEF